MTATRQTPHHQPDLLLEIDVQAGDAALLRVVATLHQRQAQVRTLRYDGSSRDSQLQVRVAGTATRRDHLVSALRRCVDVVSVRPVPAPEGAWA